MKKSLHLTTLSSMTAAAAVSGFSVAQKKTTLPSPPRDRRFQAVERKGAQPTSYAPMLAKARKSVVSVYTSEVVRYTNRSGSQDDAILRQLFGVQPRGGQGQNEVREQKIPQGVGSGVIISSDGYILTNNHVVQDQRGGDADEILVRLSDDTELEAKLIGRDPQTDIAVIKVDADDLPAIKVADSDEILVGDIVFAIGNPLGVGLTVTSGIISATQRSIGIYGQDGFEDFIQTDAAINQGNSGGALVDIEGRLIGVNSAIKSTSGGSIGLGFAIPSGLAIRTATQLTETGGVERGLIGVRMSELDPRVAEAMGVPGTKGVLIEEVVDGYPAKEAGLRHGDIILQVNNRKVDDPNDLRLEVSTTTPGQTVSVTVLRDAGEKKTFEVEVAAPSGGLTAGDPFIEGVKAAMVDDTLRKSLGLPANARGMVVTEAAPNSPFARFLQPGLVILEINRRQFSTLAQARDLLSERGNNLLFIYANGQTSYFPLRLR